MGKFSFPPDKNGAVSKGRWGNRVRVKGRLLSLPSLAKHLNGKIKDDKLDNSLKLKRGLFGYDKKKVKAVFDKIYSIPVEETIPKKTKDSESSSSCKTHSSQVLTTSNESSDKDLNWLTERDQRALSKLFEGSSFSPLEARLINNYNLEKIHEPVWIRREGLADPVLVLPVINCTDEKPGVCYVMKNNENGRWTIHTQDNSLINYSRVEDFVNGYAATTAAIGEVKPSDTWWKLRKF